MKTYTSRPQLATWFAGVALVHLVSDSSDTFNGLVKDLGRIAGRFKY